MQKHVTLLGALFIVYHSLGILLGFFVLSLFSGIGLLSGEWETAGMMTLLGFLGGFFLLAVAVPGLIAGLFQQGAARATGAAGAAASRPAA